MDIIVLPDTAGTIDLRPKIRIEYVSDLAQIRGLSMSTEERNALPGSVLFTNIFQSIALIRSSQGEYVYDMTTRQLI